MSEMIGVDIDHYHILEQLGQGGMATVYKAYDVRDNREVAVKLIRADHLLTDQADKLLLRFEIERRIASLKHPNMVGVVDYGTFNGAPYLVMEHVTGGTLKEFTGRRFSPAEAAKLLAPIARALHYLHQQDIIHRDVKPSNILLADGKRPLLSDFGIAKLLQAGDTAQLTSTGVSMGTPDYMAPEEALNKGVGPATDVYALGVVLFELVTGQRPFHADTPMAVLLMHIQDPLPRPRSIAPNLPMDIERVLFKALAKQPGDRYATAADFAAVLEKIAAGTPLSAREAPGPAKRYPSLLWAALAVVSGLGIIALVAVLGALAASLLSPGIMTPTPTATATVPAGFVYVTDVQGSAEGLSSGGGEAAVIGRGALLPAGPGSRVRTAAGGQVSLGLPNGAVLILGPDTELELTSVAAPNTGSTSTILNLVRGRLAGLVSLGPNEYFAVQSGSGLRAESLGSAFGAQYDPSRQRLDLDCLAGACRLIGGTGSLELEAGQHSWLDAFGGPFPADTARAEPWAYAAAALTPSAPAGEATASVTSPIASASATPAATTPPPTATPSATTEPTATEPPASPTRRPTTAPTRAPTNTSTQPPTQAPTAIPPTPVPPTSVPPTSVPPTLTPVPPDTQAPPTLTPEPPDTPEPPTLTPEPPI
jgi:tRNA A-37 threonylcarbamoyl transferase component Bud32